MLDPNMKLTISRDSLLTGLQLAARAVSSRATLPALGGIHFTEPDSLTLQATDTELGLKVTLSDAKVETDGSVLLPRRFIGDVVRSLPEGDVALALRPEERDVELTAGPARFDLRTLTSEDFPRLPELDGEAAALPGGPLAATIDRVARAGLPRRGPADLHGGAVAGGGRQPDHGLH